MYTDKLRSQLSPKVPLGFLDQMTAFYLVDAGPEDDFLEHMAARAAALSCLGNRKHPELPIKLTGIARLTLKHVRAFIAAGEF